MHDPYSMAFEIKSPFKKKSTLFPKGNRNTLITIWHKDPEKDGSDDSCGWFIRERHIKDKQKLKEIESQFRFNIEHNYWFTERGVPIFSTIGILMIMYKTAYWIHCCHNRKKMDRFFVKNTHKIIHDAENPVDCFGDIIINKWNDKRDKFRFVDMASMIYTDILRKERKWYQHPKWHIHHWRIRFNILIEFYTKYLKICDVCHNIGFGTSYGFSDWSGSKSWCGDCNNKMNKNETEN